MKRFSFLTLATVMILLNTNAYSQTSFCLTATDAYGGGPTSTFGYTVPAAFQYYYIFHDTDNEARAKVQLFADGDPGPIWYTDCGCGTNVIDYATNSGHVIHFEVEIVACPGESIDSGSVSVKIYTPDNNQCKTACKES